MVRQVYSLSALAVELGRDRRTIAKAVNRVPPDGTGVGGHPGWYLRTAARALERKSSGKPLEMFCPSRDEGGIVKSFVDRTHRRRQRSNDPGIIFDVDQLTEAFGPDRETTLIWLKAGLPYWKEGDWESGEGFQFIAHWVFDWLTLTLIASDAGGEQESAAKLRLPGVHEQLNYENASAAPPSGVQRRYRGL